MMASRQPKTSQLNHTQHVASELLTHEEPQGHQPSPISTSGDKQGHSRPTNRTGAEILCRGKSLDQVGRGPHADDCLSGNEYFNVKVGIAGHI